MATKLDKTIKRELDMDGQAYTVAISPEGVKLTQKGFRKGREMSWKAFWALGTEEGAASGAPGGASAGS
jgi:ribosomal protein S5